MRLVIAAVGRLKAGPEHDLAARYHQRALKAGRALGIRDISLGEVREGRAGALAPRRLEEADALNAQIPSGAVRIALEESGENLTSQRIAADLRRWSDSGTATVAFVIGGADGLDPSLVAEADAVLAFGAATWPHQLVRVMLLEQLYRAVTILSGHPYHRD